MARIIDSELVSIPLQRSYALTLFKNRWRKSIAPDLCGKIADEILNRWMARTWIRMARRQEILLDNLH